MFSFQTDKGFDKGIFNKQMSVMRGQVIMTYRNDLNMFSDRQVWLGLGKQ